MNQPQVASLNDPNALKAIVGKVRGEGHNRFAIAYLDKDLTNPKIGKGESITFSLTVWKGENEPCKDQVVMLENVTMFRQGWRAMSARPITLEPQATRKEPL